MKPNKNSNSRSGWRIIPLKMRKSGANFWAFLLRRFSPLQINLWIKEVKDNRKRKQMLFYIFSFFSFFLFFFPFPLFFFPFSCAIKLDWLGRIDALDYRWTGCPFDFLFLGWKPSLGPSSFYSPLGQTLLVGILLLINNIELKQSGLGLVFEHDTVSQLIGKRLLRDGSLASR